MRLSLRGHAPNLKLIKWGLELTYFQLCHIPKFIPKFVEKSTHLQRKIVTDF